MQTHSHLFRRYHAIQLLSSYDLLKGPLDLFVSLYFRHTAQLGSKDRAYINHIVYAYFREKGCIDALYELQKKEEKKEYWDFALTLLESETTIEQAFQKTYHTLERHTQLSMPYELYMAFTASWHEKTDALCRSLNQQAPLTIRVNIAKTTIEDLITRFASYGFKTHKDPTIATALHFEKRVALFSLPEFKEGLFEIQDAGSQKVAALVEAKPKNHILDYCAGAGGKTLAIAPYLQQTGQLYLHDIRKEALCEAKKRLKRAGVQNAQYISSDEEKKLLSLQRKMDWVLVDAPCSGTGTLRRNPDMKWKYSSLALKRLVQEQQHIMGKAALFLKPTTGKLVWATCSLLQEENQEMVQYAQTQLGLISIPEKTMQITPLTGVWDGFFAATFTARKE